MFRRYSTPLPPGFKSRQGMLRQLSQASSVACSVATNQSGKTYYTNHNDLVGSISSISLASSSHEPGHINGSFHHNQRLYNPKSKFSQQYVSSDSELENQLMRSMQRRHSFKRALKSDPVNVSNNQGERKKARVDQDSGLTAGSSRMTSVSERRAGPQFGMVTGNHDSISIDV